MSSGRAACRDSSSGTLVPRRPASRESSPRRKRRRLSVDDIVDEVEITARRGSDLTKTLAVLLRRRAVGASSMMQRASDVTVTVGRLMGNPVFKLRQNSWINALSRVNNSIVKINMILILGNLVDVV